MHIVNTPIGLVLLSAKALVSLESKRDGTENAINQMWKLDCAEKKENEKVEEKEEGEEIRDTRII